VSRWHQRGVSATDRARQVARTCWEALHRVDPDAARLIAWAAREAGEGWLVPEPARHTRDDLVGVLEAAELVGYKARTIYDWISCGRLAHTTDRQGHIRVHVGTLLDFVAARMTGKETP
jgi:excisionase family DNA binding protein